MVEPVANLIKRHHVAGSNPVLPAKFNYKIVRIMKARIINGVIWATIAVVLITYCAIEWHKSGCGWETLACMIGFYGACMFGVWCTIDQTIKERNQE